MYYILEKPPDNWSLGQGNVGKDDIENWLPPPSEDSLIILAGSSGFKSEVTRLVENYTVIMI